MVLCEHVQVCDGAGGVGDVMMFALCVGVAVCAVVLVMRVGVRVVCWS